MAGDTCDPSRLAQAWHPISSPQQQASHREGGSPTLKASKGHTISDSMGHDATPNMINRETYAQLLGGSGPELLLQE